MALWSLFSFIKGSSSTVDPKAIPEHACGGILGWTVHWYVKKWDLAVPGLWLMISSLPYFKVSGLFFPHTAELRLGSVMWDTQSERV